jgi:hypothetical protein
MSHFHGTDVTATALRTGNAALIVFGHQDIVGKAQPGIDGRAGEPRPQGQGGAAVVVQRLEERIGVSLVTWRGVG